jgi:hypothetical protein
VTEVISDSGAEIRFKVQGAAPTFKTAHEHGVPRTVEPLGISVVFVRDASGKKLSSKPVVCVYDEVLRPDELAGRLSGLNRIGVNGVISGPEGAGAVITIPPSEVLITAEKDVPYEVLESVVEAVSQRGISKVRFVAKDAAAPTYTPLNGASEVPTDEFRSRGNVDM